MPWTKQLALGFALVLTSCGAPTAGSPSTPSPETARDDASTGMSRLSPAQRMPIIQAKNAAVVARTHTFDARDAYDMKLAQLARARKKKWLPSRIRDLTTEVEMLRAKWQVERATQNVADAELALARARVAKKHNLSGYGSVKRLEKRVASARADAKQAVKHVDRALAMSQVPAVWEVSKNTSHNLQSRLMSAIKFFEEMAAIIEKSKSNCRRMARGLQSLFLNQSPMVSRLRDGAESQPVKIAAKYDKYRPRADAAATRMVPGITACIRDDRIKRLLRRLSPPRFH